MIPMIYWILMFNIYLFIDLMIVVMKIPEHATALSFFFIIKS